MALVEDISDAVSSPSWTKEGMRRTRELYRYLTPATLSSTPRPHPRVLKENDTVYDAPNITPSLLPFVQLVALRCDTAKAMLNVIDKDTMYFLAQASKRSQDGPKDMPMFESSEDSVLMGCSSVPLSGRVCELTIRMHPNEKCRYPFFTIPDMSKDPRFASLDVVANEPNFKFYCGTPITTRDGINIGSLAVMDTQPREKLSDDEEQCLGETAAHIMKYLELNREAIEGRQARRMGYALSSFVAGKSTLADVKSEGSMKRPLAQSLYGIDEAVSKSRSHTLPQPPRRRNKRKRLSAQERRRSIVDNSDSAFSSTTSDHEGSELSTKDQEESADEMEELESRSHSKTFARAANLVREALEIGNDGGVLFVGVTADSTIPTFISDGLVSQGLFLNIISTYDLNLIIRGWM